jgi:chemotaxis protein histidine kinase CheA/ActR/RegA family two-component response regulator
LTALVAEDNPWELGLEIDLLNLDSINDSLAPSTAESLPLKDLTALADEDNPWELGTEIDLLNLDSIDDSLAPSTAESLPLKDLTALADEDNPWELGTEIDLLSLDLSDDSLATSTAEFSELLEDLADLADGDNPLELGTDIAILSLDSLDDNSWNFVAEFESESRLAPEDRLLDELLPGDEWDLEDEPASISVTQEHLLDELLPGDEWDLEDEPASISVTQEHLLDELLPGDEWDLENEPASISVTQEHLLDELLPGDEWDLENEPASIFATQEHLLDELLPEEDLKSDSLDSALQNILIESAISVELTIESSGESREIGDFLDDFLCDFDLETYSSSQDPSNNTPDLKPELAVLPLVALPALSIPPVPEIHPEATTQSNTETRRNIQIPVPLVRLDRSAQQVVDTLLTTRGINSQSQNLQTQLVQLTGLTAESAQFATKLRQLQDDYSLMRNISDEQDTSNNLTLERYRQGYTTIERLLENILRMSELGQELEISTRQTFDKLADLDRQILRLKDGIEVSRLVPFRNLTMRARAILRDLTNRYGKPVDLMVNNEQIELDAGVVQQLEPALLHLLRNAFDHGIEPTVDRLAIGKPATAKVTISLQRRGNVYRLTLEDDGRGIDRSKIADRSQAGGFAHTNTSTNADLLIVLCQPGFSSRDVVSEVSGRGVGMDVVAHQIAAIGGKLSLDTVMGKGSTFSIEVPAPQLLVSCVLLQVGDRTVALPTANILETVLLSTIDSQLAIDRSHWQITTAAGVTPGFSLTSYWQHFSSSLPEYAIGLRCRLEDNSAVWLIADDLLYQSDLSINPLPSPLMPPAGLLGVSLQPDGRLISVLDPIALTDVLKSQSRIDTPTPKSAMVTTTTTILVVDDAALMRRRLSASLTTAGYVIHTCGDGLEALKWLEMNELPAMMITDVEMPNMDGLTLIDRCRQIGIEIPILVISSRLSEGWSNEAKRVGANNYLNKGFTTDMLLTTVGDLLTPQRGTLEIKTKLLGTQGLKN